MPALWASKALSRSGRTALKPLRAHPAMAEDQEPWLSPGRRGHRRGARRPYQAARRSAATTAAAIYAFDLLRVGGEDLRPLPLSERRGQGAPAPRAARLAGTVSRTVGLVTIERGRRNLRRSADTVLTRAGQRRGA